MNLIVGGLVILSVIVISFICFPRMWGFPDIRHYFVFWDNASNKPKHCNRNKNTIPTGFRRFSNVMELRIILNDCIEVFNSSVFSQIENINIPSNCINEIKIKWGNLGSNILGEAIGTNITIDKKIADDSTALRNTIAHELAHVIDHLIRGFSVHDEFWQRINDACGGSEENYWDNITSMDETEEVENETTNTSSNCINSIDFSEYEYVEVDGQMSFLNYLTGHRVTKSTDPALYHKLNQYMLYDEG